MANKSLLGWSLSPFNRGTWPHLRLSKGGCCGGPLKSKWWKGGVGSYFPHVFRHWKKYIQVLCACKVQPSTVCHWLDSWHHFQPSNILKGVCPCMQLHAKMPEHRRCCSFFSPCTALRSQSRNPCWIPRPFVQRKLQAQNKPKTGEPMQALRLM